MRSNQALVGVGYFIGFTIFIGYLANLAIQFIKNIGYPFKVPLNFNPMAMIDNYILMPTVIGVVLLLAGVCTAFAYIVNYGMPNHDERNFRYSARGTYGTARWMSADEMKNVFKIKGAHNAEGIILGKKYGKLICLPKDTRSNKNIAVYGAPGTKKSRAFVRPMIYERMKAEESMVITDPKGELYRDTAQLLRQNGYNVKVFNLKAFESSDSWNCLGEIEGGQVDLMAAIFTDIIIRNTSNEFTTNDFWDNAELNLLKALVLHVGASPNYNGKRTIGAVYNMITQLGVNGLDEIFKKEDVNDPAIKPYNIFEQAGNLRPNIIVGLGTRLQVFQNNQVVNATSLPDIDLLSPGKEKCVYYVITSDQSSTFDFLASLFFSFMFIRLVDYADSLDDGKLPVPVYFIMDEFPNIGAIPDFEKKISTVRSRDISISIVFQNLAQMQNRYPHGVWEEILGNCDTHLFLGCTDQTTANYISSRTGEVTVIVDTTRQTRKTLAVAQYIPEYQKSVGDGKRLLMTMDEVLRMDRDEMLVIANGKPVLKLDKYDFTEHPLSKDLEISVHTDHVPQWRQQRAVAEERMKRAMEEQEERIESEATIKDDFVGETSKPVESPRMPIAPPVESQGSANIAGLDPRTFSVIEEPPVEEAPTPTSEEKGRILFSQTQGHKIQTEQSDYEHYKSTLLETNADRNPTLPENQPKDESVPKVTAQIPNKEPTLPKSEPERIPEPISTNTNPTLLENNAAKNPTLLETKAEPKPDANDESTKKQIPSIPQSTNIVGGAKLVENFLDDEEMY